MSKLRVLVTGCAGYIGSMLVPELLRVGCKVLGVDSLRYGNGKSMLGFIGDPDFYFFDDNVISTERMVRHAEVADVVIPLAGLVGAPVCDRHPEEARLVNYDAVADLLKRMSRQQVVLFPNTNSGYGQTDGTSMVNEASPMNPVSLYGRTKCDAEKAVLDFGGTVFRLATVFGASPRMRFDLMVQDFTRRLVNAKRALAYPGRTDHPTTLSIFEGHFQRNFVHVRDVVRVFVANLHGSNRGVYNVGNPHANMTKTELAHVICDVLCLPDTVVVDGQGRDPDQRNYLVCNDKLLRTGFRFRYGLGSGIAEVARVLDHVTDAEAKAMGNA